MPWILVLFFIPKVVFAQVPTPAPAPVVGGPTSAVSESQLLQNTGRWIVEHAETEDVTSRYKALEKYMVDHDIPNSRYGIDLEFLRGTAERSRRLPLERTSKRIELDAKNGKIDGLAQVYRAQGKKAGLSESQIDSFLSKQLKIAAAASEKMKRSCTPVDLRPELGPVRDQDSMGWCYAFAAADLFSYKTKQKISAADIAFTYNKTFRSDIRRVLGANENDFVGGAPKEALYRSAEKGLCLEKDFPSEDNANSNMKTNLDLIDKLIRGEQRSSALECPEVATAARALFPNLEFSDIRKIALTTVDKDIVQKMANQSCKTRIAAPFTPVSFRNEDKEEFMQNMDARLDEKNPMILTYDSGILLNTESELKLPDHGSVIAGRRFNQQTGQCEYLLRNSWGRGCDGYDPKLACEEGTLWIPRTDIQQRAYNATFIK